MLYVFLIEANIEKFSLLNATLKSLNLIATNKLKLHALLSNNVEPSSKVAFNKFLSKRRLFL